MSITSAVYSCDDCGFSQSGSISWGHFNYRHDGGLLNVNRTLGWCDCCATIVPIEVLPSPNDYELKLKAHIRLNAEYSIAYRDLVSQQSLISRALRIKPTLPTDSRKIKNALSKLEKEINDMRSRFTIFSERKSGPRCLLCGSDSATPLPKFEMPHDDKDHSPIFVMVHIGCGGHLSARHQSTRFSMRFKERFYDLEGRLID